MFQPHRAGQAGGETELGPGALTLGQGCFPPPRPQRLPCLGSNLPSADIIVGILVSRTHKTASLTESSAEDELLLALRLWGAGEGGTRLAGAAVSYLLRRFTSSHQRCPLLYELLGPFQSGF